MSLIYATKYNVQWSQPIRTWRGSFKTALFDYGLDHIDVELDTPEELHIPIVALERVAEAMRRESINHQITSSLDKDTALLILTNIIKGSPVESRLARIKWIQ